MHPGAEPDGAQASENIHAILERFSSWADKQRRGAGSAAGGEAEVREIAYDEAVRKFRADARAGTSVAAREGPAGAVIRHSASALKDEKRDKHTAATAVSTGRRAGSPETAAVKVRRAGRKGASAAQKAKPGAASGMTADEHDPKSASRSRSHKRSSSPAGADAAQAPVSSTRDAEQARASANADFRQVLAQKVNAAAERGSRITIRFSREEEQRLREMAMGRGITVSAYLRQRALAAEEPGGARDAAPDAAGAAQRAQPPATHPVGRWLAGFRQRWVPFPSR